MCLCVWATLIKKKIKFSSYIGKFRVEQLQSHIWLTASSYMGKYFRSSSYIRKPFLIYDFATAPLWISLYMRKIFFFLSVHSPHTVRNGAYPCHCHCVCLVLSDPVFFTIFVSIFIFCLSGRDLLAFGFLFNVLALNRQKIFCRRFPHWNMLGGFILLFIISIGF